MFTDTPSEPMHCAVIRHVDIEDLGYLGEGLQRRGLRVRYTDAESLSQGSQLHAAALIVLGGPMSVYEMDRYPYLSHEIELIRGFLDLRRPVLGICLGAQLLAAAAGARVFRGQSGKEIGWAPVTLTAEGGADPLWAGFPSPFDTFHWHGDTFDRPSHATILARTPAYIQAFRLGPSAYGVQFHPEVVPAQLESWIRAYRLELERERLSSDDVLAVPDEGKHRHLARVFADNVANWLVESVAALNRR